MGDRIWTAEQKSGRFVQHLSIPSVVEAKVTDCGKQGVHLSVDVADQHVEQFYEDEEIAKKKAVEIATGFFNMALRQLQNVVTRG